jgi:hypothetical protein
MAIVINGSGTVTGLAVGGLPDGTVDTDTLANTTVTAAKVAADVATQAEIDAKLNLAGGTLTGDLNFGDNVDANFGAGGDLKIYHDGSHSYITDTGTGNLKVRTNKFYIDNADSSKDMAIFIDGGECQLYHNNNIKLQTTATGVTVTGTVAGATNLAYAVASGTTSGLSTNDSATVYGVTGTHTSYLVTASANDSITNVMALVSIGTSTSTMRITNLSGSYNTTVTGSGTAIQITCGYGSNLVYQYRVLQLR